MAGAWTTGRVALRGGWLPLAAVSLGAWALLFAKGALPILPPLCAPGLHGLAAAGAGIEAALALNPIGAMLPGWLLMLCAMMLPLLHSPLARLCRATAPGRRAQAAMLFVLAYMALWLAAIALLTLASVALRGLGDSAALAIALGLAIVWQGSATKARCLAHCHAAPVSRPARLGSASHGLCAGLACIGSCWAMMLVPLLAGTAHHLAMVAAAGIMLWERHHTGELPRRRK